MDGVLTVRAALRADSDAVHALWRAANRARCDEYGLPVGPFAENDPGTRHRVVDRLADPDTCVVLAEGDGVPVATALALPALVRDGAGPDPVPGLAHVSMVAVRPDRWGQGLGGLVLGAVLDAARGRGHTRAQLWTHETNLRAQALYRRRGWTASGRTGTDEHGEPIRHHTRTL